jgi:hypothetical protein
MRGIPRAWPGVSPVAWFALIGACGEENGPSNPTPRTRGRGPGTWMRHLEGARLTWPHTGPTPMRAAHHLRRMLGGEDRRGPKPRKPRGARRPCRSWCGERATTRSFTVGRRRPRGRSNHRAQGKSSHVRESASSTTAIRRPRDRRAGIWPPTRGPARGTGRFVPSAVEPRDAVVPRSAPDQFSCNHGRPE